MRDQVTASLRLAAGLALALGACLTAAANPAAAQAREKIVRVERRDGDAPAEVRRESRDDLGLLASDPGGAPRRVVIRERTDRRGMGRGMRMHRGGIGAFATLDLTEAQRTKLADLRDRQQRRAIQARADLQIARLDLRKLLRAGTPSGPAINSQIDRISRMRADLQKSRVATMLEARSVLTPGQRQQLRERRAGGMRDERMRSQGEPGGSAPRSD